MECAVGGGEQFAFGVVGLETRVRFGDLEEPHPGSEVAGEADVGVLVGAGLRIQYTYGLELSVDAVTS